MATDDDDRYLAIAERQGELEDRLTSVDTGLGELRGTVSRLGEQLEDLAVDAHDDDAATPWWPDLEPKERAAGLAELMAWIERTLPDHLPGVTRALTKCWRLHHNVVDELTMLHTTWKAAYKAPRAGATEAANWLDRWVPGAERRIQASLRDCRSAHDLHKDTVPELKE